MKFDFEPKKFVDECIVWLKEIAEKSGIRGTVAGISGGIDSAVTAAICKKAFGDNHLALHLDIESSPSDYRNAQVISKQLGIDLVYLNINPAYKTFLNELPAGTNLAVGNIKARMRMVVLYYYSNLENKLVVGTGNKSELMIGYFTKYGDGACDVLPLGSLFKTQVREVARFLDIPEEIIEKPPSAGLWKGQTDEGEIGMSYEELDEILWSIENRETKDIGKKKLRKVKKMIKNSKHKRKLPAVFQYN